MSNLTHQSTRREFLQRGSVAAGSLIIMGTKASAGIKGANDRVRIAVVGLGGRGQAHISGWAEAANTELVYVIDPDSNAVKRCLGGLQSRAQAKLNTKGITDYREALDDNSLDAISIATPNHWHSLMTIHGAQAGKHVYVEKPMSHDIGEGRIAMEAQKKYGVVVQHGTQSRSDGSIAGLHEMLKSGELPKLKIAYGYCCKPRAGIGSKPIGQPPANLDWELWKGPAVIENYHGNYHPYNWHWFWETGNGDLNNQGTHQLDIARWAIDDDQTHPTSAVAVGGRFQWNDQSETPNTMFAAAKYPNGQMVFFNVRNVNYKDYKHQVCNEYYLEDGSLITREGNSGYKILRPGTSEPEPLEVPKGKVTAGGFWNAFITAVRANDPQMANGNATEAHYSCTLGHLMNNSYRLGKQVPFAASSGDFADFDQSDIHFGRLHESMRDGVGLSEADNQYTLGPVLSFDPKTERFVGQHAEAANRLLKDPNNSGFEIPELKTV